MSDSGESDKQGFDLVLQMSDSAESDAQSEGTDGTEDTEDTGTGAQGAGEADAASRSAETGTHATENGRVSSDIMDTDGTEFRVSGIVDTGGNEDSIIYATTADVAKLAGSKRGADVVEYW